MKLDPSVPFLHSGCPFAARVRFGPTTGSSFPQPTHVRGGSVVRGTATMIPPSSLYSVFCCLHNPVRHGRQISLSLGATRLISVIGSALSGGLPGCVGGHTGAQVGVLGQPQPKDTQWAQL